MHMFIAWAGASVVVEQRSGSKTCRDMVNFKTG